MGLSKSDGVRTNTKKALWITHRGPEALDLEEDVDDASVSEEGDDPEEEEEDSEEVGDQGVGGRELAPVLINNLGFSDVVIRLRLIQERL